MDKALFVPSALIAGILFLVYTVQVFRNNLEFEQNAVVNIILQSFQLVCGIVLVASTFIESLAELVSDLNLYVLVAGAVLSVNAVKSVYRDMPRKYQLEGESGASAVGAESK
ncbi:hypothetical protein [Microbulbifer sp. MCCC 1A16149]|uniref:hypothetical protein n=1 Tax=Microbulbifer sp. MCCC 1A16149 TaxID=3411322 RepID=UPI003D0C329B